MKNPVKTRQVRRALNLSNKWVKKSIGISRKPGYLDKLMEVYPSDIPGRRELDELDKKEIKKFYDGSDGEGLLRKLLELRRSDHPFPFEHPYVPLLGREQNKLTGKNPVIMKKLADILLSEDVEDIIKGCGRPPDINRIMGSSFRNWLRDKFSKENGYPVLSESYFKRHSSGIAILNAANAGIREYISRELGIELKRGRDLLIKVNRRHVLGEARFLSTTGGSQRRDLEEVIEFVKEGGEIIRIAVLDGVMWFAKPYVEMLCELKEGEPALSSLLLKDFLEELKQG